MFGCQVHHSGCAPAASEAGCPRITSGANQRCIRNRVPTVVGPFANSSEVRGLHGILRRPLITLLTGFRFVVVLPVGASSTMALLRLKSPTL